MTTGANEDGFHLKNVSIERDIKVTAWFDLRTVTRRRAVRQMRQAAENSPRHRGRPRLQAWHEIQREVECDVSRRGRFAQAVGDGLLRHRRHAHVAGDHRAGERQGRRHLAVERRAVSSLHHAAGRRAGEPGDAACGKILRGADRERRGRDSRRPRRAARREVQGLGAGGFSHPHRAR